MTRNHDCNISTECLMCIKRRRKRRRNKKIKHDFGTNFLNYARKFFEVENIPKYKSHSYAYN